MNDLDLPQSIWPGSGIAGAGGRETTAGFSLIEVLVAFVVLCVLIAILVPTLRRATEAAHGARCVGNLRSIAIGLVGYANENRGNVPPRSERMTDAAGNTLVDIPGQFSNPEGWMYLYIENTFKNYPRVFLCPGDKTADKGTYKGKPTPTWRYSNYALNADIFLKYVNNVSEWGRPVKLREVHRKILYADGVDFSEINPWKGPGEPPNATTDGGTGSALLHNNRNRVISRRHHGMGNVLFGDGSVGLVNPDDPALEEQIKTSKDIN